MVNPAGLMWSSIPKLYALFHTHTHTHNDMWCLKYIIVNILLMKGIYSMYLKLPIDMQTSLQGQGSVLHAYYRYIWQLNQI